MFRHLRRGIVPLLLAAMLVSVGLLPAHASAANFVQLTDVAASSCTPGDWALVNLVWAAPEGTGTHHWSLSNPRAGTVTTFDLPYVGPSGGPGNYSLLVPAGTVAGDTLRMQVIVDPVGAEIGSFAELAFNCSTGAVSGNVFIQDYLPGLTVGAPIPAGFVLRAVTCDSAVFDTPGGQPVGEAKVSAGQTWYVNPTAVTGPDGASWTEIFVSGRTNPFIPTACVGG